MSLKKECELLKELNDALRKQIEQLLNLRPFPPGYDAGVMMGQKHPIMPGSPHSPIQFDSYRYRGWPMRCSDTPGMSCLYHAVPGLSPNGYPGTAGGAMEARCKYCGHPPITSTYVVSNGNPNLTGKGNHS